jgi:hypothetical protein
VDLEVLDLPRRTELILRSSGVTSVEELTALNERQLRAIRGVGARTLAAVRDALLERGFALAEDPWAAYLCARHGERSWDTSLSSLYLCEVCAAQFQEKAFGDEPPCYVGSALEGYCLHCNERRADIRLRQWFLCGVCDRVVRSIGRSVVAARYVLAVWENRVAPVAPTVEFRETDVPELQPRSKETIAAKVATADFMANDRDSGELLFGVELKTGKSYITGDAIGSKMGQFQLDTSDCDDILTVVDRERVPVYLAHVQVVDRAEPPTVRYAALGLW